jgi:hypothetical protein
MRGDKGIGNVQIYHQDSDHYGPAWMITTNADGFFTDTFHFNKDGGHYLNYYYWEEPGDQDHRYYTDIVVIYCTDR